MFGGVIPYDRAERNDVLDELYEAQLVVNGILYYRPGNKRFGGGLIDSGARSRCVVNKDKKTKKK